MRIIRNSQGETEEECVRRLGTFSPRKRQALIAQAQSIAARFLEGGDREMSNFYESVASDLAASLGPVSKRRPAARKNYITEVTRAGQVAQFRIVRRELPRDIAQRLAEEYRAEGFLARIRLHSGKRTTPLRYEVAILKRRVRSNDPSRT